MTYIYTILSPTNKIYVGQTVNFARRVSCYKNLHCKHQDKLYNSLQKHGWSSHKCRPVIYLSDNASPETLTYWEQFVIDFYKEQGYTLLNLREAGSKGKPSLETRIKMRESQLGDRNHRFGKKISPDHIRKIREANLGKPRPENVRKKIGLANLGKKHSVGAIQKMRKAALGRPGFWLGKKRVGKKHSEKTKQKIRESHLGEKNPSFKGYILAYKNNIFVGKYAGCVDASKQLSISWATIIYSINKQRALVRGVGAGYQFIREPLNKEILTHG